MVRRLVQDLWFPGSVLDFEAKRRFIKVSQLKKICTIQTLPSDDTCLPPPSNLLDSACTISLGAQPARGALLMSQQPKPRDFARHPTGTSGERTRGSERRRGDPKRSGPDGLNGQPSQTKATKMGSDLMFLQIWMTSGQSV